MNYLEVLTENNELTQTASFDLATLEKEIKRLSDMRDELKAKLLEEMQTRGIVKLESDEVVVNLISATERETFDSKRFRADHPDTFDEYVRFTSVKPSLRIKVK